MLMKDSKGGRPSVRTRVAAAWGAWVLMALVAALAGCAGFGRVEKLAGGRSDLGGLEETLPQDVGLWKEESSLPENPSLSDYLAYAALHNPGMQAAFDAWKAALWKIPQVRSLPDPMFTYTYLVQGVETRLDTKGQRFTLAQTFPWLSRLELQEDAAFQEAQAKRALYEAAKWDLFERVKKAYYEYAYLRQAVAVTEENIGLLRNLERVFQTQYAASLAPYGALVSIQTELGRLEDRLNTLRDLRRPASEELNAALNRPEKGLLPWPPPARVTTAAPSDEEAQAWLLAGNPELRALSHLVDKEQAGEKLAQKNYFPDVTVSLELEVEDTEDAMNGAAADGDTNTLGVGVSVNVPIWWPKYKAGVQEARHGRRAAAETLKERRNALSARLSMTLYKLRDAQRRIDLYQNGLIPKARQALQVSLQDFEAGLGGYLEVIDAQRMLLEFQLALERAEADKAQGLAEVEGLVGRFLEENPAESAEKAMGESRKRAAKP